jgi:hypothetical protein
MGKEMLVMPEEAYRSLQKKILSPNPVLTKWDCMVLDACISFVCVNGVDTEGIHHD